MGTKGIMLTTTIIGSTVGSFIPLIWGASLLSMSSILLTAIGGFAGIYIGYKLTV